jgi:cytochrome c-type biogenesis protein CcmE
MKPAYLIATVVIAVCMVVTMYTFSGAVANHVNIAHAKTKPHDVIQVPGDIDKSTVIFDAVRGRLEFEIVDRKDKSQRMKVVYAQPKPENFDTANSVEAIGSYKNGVFVAQNLLVKCPSKYNDEKPAYGEQKPAAVKASG